MSKNLQYVMVGLLIVVIALQVTLISKIDSIKPKPEQVSQGEPRIPTLQDIDGRIMHWGQHFGATFSGSSRISSLNTKMNKRFDILEKKLDALEQEGK